MDDFRFAGFRVIDFSVASKTALREIAQILMPSAGKILHSWVALQCRAWQPPGFTREELEVVFRDILDKLLTSMSKNVPEECMAYLEEVGTTLALRQFPYEALIITLHFLEESYMPILLDRSTKRTTGLLIAMDEFLHAALAALATSYFEAYRKELLDQAEVGRIVQESLLADIPKTSGDLDIAYIYESAAERAQLGGDFLDYFELRPGVAAFLIGDLSGHGLEAAADSVTIRSLFRGFMREDSNIGSATTRLNRVLDTELRSDQFATALVVTYGPEGRLQLVNAGHPSAILANGEPRLLNVHGMALAIDTSFVYKAEEAVLEPGGVLVAYTDGIIEAHTDSSLFGEQRALDVVRSMADAPPRAIAERLVDEALRHAGGKFSDDVAVLVIRRRG